MNIPINDKMNTLNTDGMNVLDIGKMNTLEVTSITLETKINRPVLYLIFPYNIAMPSTLVPCNIAILAET